MITKGGYQADHYHDLIEERKNNPCNIMKTGAEFIAEERKEQIEKHGFDVVKDADYYQKGELVEAAIYALTGDRQRYPQSWEFWFHDKMTAKRERLSDLDFAVERLKIAGALIAAEIDRISNP